MTNYNEKLNKILNFIKNYNMNTSTKNFNKTTNRDKAKQAPTSLIKELVDSAKVCIWAVQ